MKLRLNLTHYPGLFFIYRKRTISQIRIFKNLLTDNGKIAFVTHDFSSSLAWILKKKWPPFCLQHPQLYSDKVFKNLSKLASLNYIGSHKTTNWLDLGGITLEEDNKSGITKFKLSFGSEIMPMYLGRKIGSDFKELDEYCKENNFDLT